MSPICLSMTYSEKNIKFFKQVRNVIIRSFVRRDDLGNVGFSPLGGDKILCRFINSGYPYTKYKMKCSHLRLPLLVKNRLDR